MRKLLKSLNRTLMRFIHFFAIITINLQVQDISSKQPQLLNRTLLKLIHLFSITTKSTTVGRFAKVTKIFEQNSVEIHSLLRYYHYKLTGAGHFVKVTAQCLNRFLFRIIHIFFSPLKSACLEHFVKVSTIVERNSYENHSFLRSDYHKSPNVGHCIEVAIIIEWKYFCNHLALICPPYKP